jgi:hypothetical protein
VSYLQMTVHGAFCLLGCPRAESESESESLFDQQSVGQCVLVSSPFLGF